MYNLMKDAAFRDAIEVGRAGAGITELRPQIYLSPLPIASSRSLTLDASLTIL